MRSLENRTNWSTSAAIFAELLNSASGGDSGSVMETFT
jgi:hypothetical protein